MNLRQLRGLLSYKLGTAKWLFIHIPKNAGVAIAKHPELGGKLVRAEPFFHVSKEYTKNLLQAMNAAGEHHGYQHARLQDIRMDLRKKLQPVAVVRNPWARVASRYRFAQTIASQGKAGQYQSGDTFESFLEQRHEFGNLPYYWHRAVRGWYPQADYVTDENGKLAVNILRQEFLAADATEYFKLKSPPQPRNVSTVVNKDGYGAYYTPRTVQIVADWYKKDIELFGFDFDTSAQRNFFIDK